MKYFVVHHPVLVDRRKKLEKQFNDYGISNCDVEWVTDFPGNQMHKIKEITKSPLQLGYISCSMKYYTVFKKMIDENIPHAIVFEDDVIFTEYFDTSKIPLDIPYVKLCRPLGDSFCTSNGEPFVCYNNGCCEAYYLTKEFAEVCLKNIHLHRTFDLECHNTLIRYYNAPGFLCIPMCYQDSPTTINHEKVEYSEHWTEYVSNKYPTFDYEFLLHHATHI